MKYQVKLFAAARQFAGVEQVEVEIAEPATVGQLRAALAAEHPPLAPLMLSSLIAVNAEYASESDRLYNGAEIALIPPVSGG